MKKLIVRSSMFFSAINLVLFLISFIPIYVMELDELPQAYTYFTMYSVEIAGWFLPCVSAVILTVILIKYDMRSALIKGIPLTLTNLVYTLPYYYLIGIAYRLDSIESILLSLGVSAAYLVLFYAGVILLLFIAKWIMSRNGIDNINACEGSILDLSHPVTLTIFSISVGEFVMRLIVEIWQAISYFVEYAGDYRGDDIFYIVFRFIFLLGMLFVTHSVCHKIKKISSDMITSALDS